MRVIIDGNNWFSRAWFALKPTTSQEPEIIQADLEDRSTRSLETTLRWIEDTKKQLQPGTIAICWDTNKNFRREIFPEYKGNNEKPEGYRVAMTNLKARLLGDYWQVEASGYEADDLLAGFASEAIKEGKRCLLCSSDKDLHQCLTTGFVSQCTSMTRSLTGRLEFKVITAEKLLEEYGVNPSQWVDFRCMTGDTSDGLSGATGIGPKTARDVLVACGTLDKFYEEPFKAPVSAIKRNALLEFRSQVPLMRNLITLRPDALSKELFLTKG